MKKITKDLLKHMQEKNLSRTDICKILNVSTKTVDRWFDDGVKISPVHANEIEMLLDKTYLPIFRLVDTKKDEIYIGNLYTLSYDAGIPVWRIDSYIERTRKDVLSKNIRYRFKVLERGDKDYWKEGYDQWI